MKFAIINNKLSVIMYLPFILTFIFTTAHATTEQALNSPAEPTMTINFQNQDDAFWEERLDGLRLKVCRYNGTERAFSGQYDKFYQEGTYHCACCGGDFALFTSDTKYDSGSGWPSFFDPIPSAVIERPDPHDQIRSLIGMPRTEVICSRCHSHLGHVFDDGPQPTGKRHCINGVSLVFKAA